MVDSPYYEKVLLDELKAARRNKQKENGTCDSLSESSSSETSQGGSAHHQAAVSSGTGQLPTKNRTDSASE